MKSSIYLDIGNSNAKWKFKGDYFEIPTSEFTLDTLPKSTKIWISSVSSSFLVNSSSNISIVNSQKKYKSLINSYDEPNMLGSDRWLAMIASYDMNPDKGFILLDIGTAITVDVVDNSGLHLGGVIFPGLRKIRNTFDHFPVSNEINNNELSQSTSGAWSSGTLNLIVNGINQNVYDLKTSHPDANIYITGGGFKEVEQYLNFSYNYHKNLVLDGLELFANNVG